VYYQHSSHTKSKTQQSVGGKSTLIAAETTTAGLKDILSKRL